MGLDGLRAAATSAIQRQRSTTPLLSVVIELLVERVAVVRVTTGAARVIVVAEWRAVASEQLAHSTWQPQEGRWCTF